VEERDTKENINFDIDQYQLFFLFFISPYHDKNLSSYKKKITVANNKAFLEI